MNGYQLYTKIYNAHYHTGATELIGTSQLELTTILQEYYKGGECVVSYD